MKNHLGQYECKLCLTIHNTEVRKLCIELLTFKLYKGELLGSHARKETSVKFVSVDRKREREGERRCYINDKLAELREQPKKLPRHKYYQR